MKLKSFEKPLKTTASRLSPIATFSISKANILTFNRVAQEVLALKAGDYVEFLNDEDEQKDWYFRKTDESNVNAFALREVKTGGVSIANVALAQYMRQTIKCGEKTVKYRVATQPDETYNVYAILTALDLNKK